LLLQVRVRLRERPRGHDRGEHERSSCSQPFHRSKPPPGLIRKAPQLNSALRGTRLGALPIAGGPQVGGTMPPWLKVPIPPGATGRTMEEAGWRVNPSHPTTKKEPAGVLPRRAFEGRSRGP